MRMDELFEDSIRHFSAQNHEKSNQNVVKTLKQATHAKDIDFGIDFFRAKRKRQKQAANSIQGSACSPCSFAWNGCVKIARMLRES